MGHKRGYGKKIHKFLSRTKALASRKEEKGRKEERKPGTRVRNRDRRARRYLGSSPARGRLEAATGDRRLRENHLRSCFGFADFLCVPRTGSRVSQSQCQW
ncbi:hypothetical protein GW17_00003336, partial [Ensete ventricosum]